MWSKEKRQYDDRLLPRKNLGIGALDKHASKIYTYFSLTFVKTVPRTTDFLVRLYQFQGGVSRMRRYCDVHLQNAAVLISRDV